MYVSKNRDPQNGWFITENPIKMDDFGFSPIFGLTPMYVSKQWRFIPLVFFRKKKLHTRKLTWFTQKWVVCVVEGGGSRSVFVGVCFRMCQFLGKCSWSDFRATKSGGNWSEYDLWGNLLHRKWWKKIWNSYEPRKKKNFNFPLYWLVNRILIMDYYNSSITG